MGGAVESKAEPVTIHGLALYTSMIWITRVIEQPEGFQVVVSTGIPFFHGRIYPRPIFSIELCDLYIFPVFWDFTAPWRDKDFLPNIVVDVNRKDDVDFSKDSAIRLNLCDIKLQGLGVLVARRNKMVKGHAVEIYQTKSYV